MARSPAGSGGAGAGSARIFFPERARFGPSQGCRRTAEAGRAALKHLIPGLEKLIRVPESPAGAQSPRNVTEISRALSLPKNIVFWICRTISAPSAASRS